MPLPVLSDAGILTFDRYRWCQPGWELRGKAAFCIYRNDWEINRVLPSVDILGVTRVFCLVNVAVNTCESRRKSVFLSTHSVLPTQRTARKEMCQCLLSWQAVNTRDSDGERWLMWINSTQCMRLKQIHLKHHWTKALKRVSVKIGTQRRAVISENRQKAHSKAALWKKSGMLMRIYR